MVSRRRCTTPAVSVVIAVCTLLAGCAAREPTNSPAVATAGAREATGAATATPAASSSGGTVMSTSASARPTATSSTAPALSREPGPDLLHDHTWRGAEAYVADYLDRLDRSWQRPDPRLLDNRALPSCGTCTNFRKAAAGLLAKGQRHEGHILRVDRVSVSLWGGGNQVYLAVDTWQLKHDMVDARGATVRTIKGGRANTYVELVYRGRWWVEEIHIVRVRDDGTYLGP